MSNRLLFEEYLLVYSILHRHLSKVRFTKQSNSPQTQVKQVNIFNKYRVAYNFYGEHLLWYFEEDKIFTSDIR